MDISLVGFQIDPESIQWSSFFYWLLRFFEDFVGLCHHPDQFVRTMVNANGDEGIINANL